MQTQLNLDEETENIDFPYTLVYYDARYDEIREMTVDKELWEDTVQMFEDSENVTTTVVTLYMARQTRSQPYFIGEKQE